MARMIREMENEAGWVDLAYADNQYDKTAQLRERIIAFLDGEWNEYGTSTE